MTAEELKQEAEATIMLFFGGVIPEHFTLDEVVMLMTKFTTEATKELEKDYYADRPTEPYSDDDSPNDWANIAHYAEESLEKAFKRIAELEKENAELKKLFADCDTCKRTCDIGNCCKFGSAYLPDVEKTLNKQKQLTKAIELLKELNLVLKERGLYHNGLYKRTEQFLKDNEVEK